LLHDGKGCLVQEFVGVLQQLSIGRDQGRIFLPQPVLFFGQRVEIEFYDIRLRKQRVLRQGGGGQTAKKTGGKAKFSERHRNSIYWIKSSRIGLNTSMRTPDSRHFAPCIVSGGT